MARNPKVEVVIAGDPRGLNRAFGSAGRSAGRFGTAMAGVGRGAAAGFAAIAAGTVAAGIHLFNTAADLESIRNKAEIVFGDSIGFVDAWAEANAHAMGLTTSEATAVAASIADILVPMGFARDEAAEMSTEIAGLTGALSEWDKQNRSAAEIGDIVQSALTGEREALKSLGITISEADVKARLAAEGQDQLTGAALEQARAAATLALITEESADAQTSFAENSDSLQRAQAVVSARARELRDELALKLLPVFVQVGEWVLDHVVPAIEELAEWLGEKVPPIIEALQKKWEEWGPTVISVVQTVGDVTETVFDVISAAIETVIGWFQDSGDGAEEGTSRWQAAFEQVQTIVTQVVEVVTLMVQRFQKFWELFGDEILAYTKITFDFIAAVIGAVFKVIEGILDVFIGIVTGDWRRAWDGVKLIFQGVMDAIIAIFNAFWETLKLAIGLAKEGVVAAFQAVWDAITGAVQTAVDTVVGLFAGLWGAIKTAIETAIAAVGNVGTWLVDKLGIGWLISQIEKAIGLWDALKSLNPFRGSSDSISGLFDPNAGRSISAQGAQTLAAAGTVRSSQIINVNIAGSVLTERDLEWKLRDMSRRGLLTAGASVRTGSRSVL